MMLAWKSAACLAAGNTLVLKPAQVSARHTRRGVNGYPAYVLCTVQDYVFVRSTEWTKNLKRILNCSWAFVFSLCPALFYLVLI